MIVLRTLNCIVIRRSPLCIRLNKSCEGCGVVIPTNTRAKSSSAPKSATDESPNDEHDDLKKKEAKERQKAATDKLNSLLTSLEVDKSAVASSGSLLGKLNLNLAKPAKKRKPLMKENVTDKETERIELKEKAKDEFDNELKEAAKAVATSLGGDVVKTESELLQKLKQHTQTEGTTSSIPSDLFEGMKIETSKIDRITELSGTFSRAKTIRERLGIPNDEEKISPKIILKYQALKRKMTKVDLFGSGTLNIFTKPKEDRVDVPEFPQLETWDDLNREDLESRVTHAPANGFEEMIMWTKQNKIWKFPIDNEQGLEEEAKVGFHEHIFLDQLLSEGFPKKGPVRHYMELVTTGLSKNPYMTAKEKCAHIDWYRGYFQSKIDILKDLGIDE